MKPSHILFATSLTTSAMALLLAPAAEASDIALNFDLPEVSAAQPEAAQPEDKPAPEAIESVPEETAAAPLPVPSAAANPPTARDWGSQPASVYDGPTTIALKSDQGDTLANLPPAPPSPKPDEAPPPSSSAEQKTPVLSAAPDPIALTFKPKANQVATATAAASGGPNTDPEVTAQGEQVSWSQLFAGGTDSIVARAVGSAEGTRTPAGHRTPAYYGHHDPGNGVWNLGTFSYQHGANAPEEADQKQLQRLQRQTELLNKKAAAAGLTLTLEETLNGIDLANQSPWAAIGEGDYIGWLAKARQLGMEGEEAIAWARTRAFIDPDTQRWNAPGLGNNIQSISRDQERRMGAIAQALAHYPHLQQSQPPAAAMAESSPDATRKMAQDPTTDPDQEDVDIIFDVSLDPPAEQANSASAVPANSPELAPAITDEAPPKSTLPNPNQSMGAIPTEAAASSESDAPGIRPFSGKQS